MNTKAKPLSLDCSAEQLAKASEDVVQATIGFGVDNKLQAEDTLTGLVRKLVDARPATWINSVVSYRDDWGKTSRQGDSIRVAVVRVMAERGKRAQFRKGTIILSKLPEKKPSGNGDGNGNGNGNGDGNGNGNGDGNGADPFEKILSLNIEPSALAEWAVNRLSDADYYALYKVMQPKAQAFGRKQKKAA